MGTLTIVGICLSIGGSIFTTAGTAMMCITACKKMTNTYLDTWKSEVTKNIEKKEEQ